MNNLNTEIWNEPICKGCGQIETLCVCEAAKRLDEYNEFDRLLANAIEEYPRRKEGFVKE